VKLVLTFSFGRGNPEPWLYLKADVMLNAADVISGRRGVERPTGVRVWVDSGGFQLLRGVVPSLSVRDVVEAQALLNPDYAVMPDDPKSPQLCLERYREFLEVAPDVGLHAEYVPVVHTTWRSSSLRQLLEELSFNVLAVGGVAQGLGRPFRVTAAIQLLKFLWTLRKAVGSGVKLHVLGVGGPSIMPALAALEVSSADTASWVHDARYGVVRVGVKAFTVKVRGCDKLPRLPLDFECSCPACSAEPEALRSVGLRGLRARALHNAYSLLEVNRVVAQSPKDPASIAARLESRGLLSRTARALLREVEKLEEEGADTPL